MVLCALFQCSCKPGTDCFDCFSSMMGYYVPSGMEPEEGVLKQWRKVLLYADWVSGPVFFMWTTLAVGLLSATSERERIKDFLTLKKRERRENVAIEQHELDTILEADDDEGASKVSSTTDGAPILN